MDNSGNIKLVNLVRLMNEAEKHSEALNAEIKQIKVEMSSILSPLLSLSADNALELPSTSSIKRGRLENDDIKEENIVNALRSNKIPKNENMEDVTAFSTVFACGMVVNKNSGIGVWIAEDHAFSIKRGRLENDDIKEENIVNALRSNKIPKNENMEDVIAFSTIFASSMVVNKNFGIGVWIAENHALNISKHLKGDTFLYEAKLQACYEGLSLMKNLGITKVKVFVDHELVVNCFTSWLKKWKVNNWQTVEGNGVKCKELIQRIDSMVEDFTEVQWVFEEDVHGMREAKKLAEKGALLNFSNRTRRNY